MEGIPLGFLESGVLSSYECLFATEVDLCAQTLARWRATDGSSLFAYICSRRFAEIRVSIDTGTGRRCALPASKVRLPSLSVSWTSLSCDFTVSTLRFGTLQLRYVSSISCSGLLKRSNVRKALVYVSAFHNTLHTYPKPRHQSQPLTKIRESYESILTLRLCETASVTTPVAAVDKTS